MVLFLDALASLFIIVLGIIGFRRGFVEELGRLLGLVFATIFAFRFYVELGGALLNWVSMDIWITFVLSFIILFVLILSLVRILTKLIHFLFLSRSTKWVNRAMGSVFGLAKGVLIAMVFFWMAELIPNKKSVAIIQNESRMAHRMISFRQSFVHIFNLKDPVVKGETFIKDFLGDIEKNNG